MDWGVDTMIGYPVLNAEETFDLLDEEGIKFIEIAYEHFRGLDREGQDRLAEKIRDRLNTTSLKPIQMHAIFGSVNAELASTDKNTVERALEKIFRWIDYCRMLEAEVLVVHPAIADPNIGFRSLDTYKYSLEVNVRIFNRILRYAHERGILIAVENTLERVFGCKAGDLLSLIENVKYDNIGVCIDTGHLSVNHLDISTFIETTKKYLIATHIHDNYGIRDLHNPPLMGRIEWREVIESFEKVNYNKPLVMEVRGTNNIQGIVNKIRLCKLVGENLFSS